MEIDQHRVEAERLLVEAEAFAQSALDHRDCYAAGPGAQKPEIGR